MRGDLGMLTAQLESLPRAMVMSEDSGCLEEISPLATRYYREVSEAKVDWEVSEAQVEQGEFGAAGTPIETGQ